MTDKPVNKSEVMRARAWRELQRGNLRDYETLSALALERHTIRYAQERVIQAKRELDELLIEADDLIRPVE